MDDLETQDPPAGGRDRWILRALYLLCLLPLAVPALVYALHPGFRELMDIGVGHLRDGDDAALRAWASDLGIWAPIFTSILMVVAAVAAPIPQIVVTATNVLLYGWVAGGALSIVSANVAAATCYGIGRLFGDSLVRRILSPRARGLIESALDRHGALSVFLLRLAPFIPFDPPSYLAGLARMRFWPFWWATLLGQMPAGLVYSYLLDHERGDPLRMTMLFALCFLGLVLLALCAWILIARRARLRGAG